MAGEIQRDTTHESRRRGCAGESRACAKSGHPAHSCAPAVGTSIGRCPTFSGVSDRPRKIVVPAISPANIEASFRNCKNLSTLAMAALATLVDRGEGDGR